MGNVPFYDEVVEFAKGIVEELNRRRTTETDDLPEYAIAAEHAHRSVPLSFAPLYHFQNLFVVAVY